MTDQPVLSPIEGIPLELLLRITHPLSTIDLNNLRLTSRSMEQSLFNTFTHEFFSKKQFMMTEDSLQTLIDMSKTRLADHMRCVQIGIQYIPESVSRSLKSDERELRFRQGFADFFSLWSSGQHCAMLTEAFANLKNLEDVVIRDFNSKRRRRDGPGAEWNSHGAPTFFQETHVQLRSPNGAWASDHTTGQYISQVFIAVITALGQAGARPTGIEVMSRKQNELRDYAFNIPRYSEQNVLPVLANLKKLHLCLDLAWSQPHEDHSSRDYVQGAPPMLSKFLAHCPNLKNLRINEKNSGNQAFVALLNWLAGHEIAVTADSKSDSPADSKTPSLAPIVLPYLDELSLGHMKVDPELLLAVIRNFAPSISRLEIWDVTLVKKSPTGLPPRRTAWAGFLKSLCRIPDLDLHHFKVGKMYQKWSDAVVETYISLDPKDVEPTNGNYPSHSYTGSDWKYFVKELAGKLTFAFSETSNFSNVEAQEDSTDAEDVESEED